jgi:hypothetical protein
LKTSNFLLLLLTLLLLLGSAAAAADEQAWADSVFAKSLAPSEESLQEILDALGYSIDVENDAIDQSIFSPPSDLTRMVATLKHSGASSNSPFGFYPQGDVGGAAELLVADSPVGTEAIVQLAPGDLFGLYLGPTLYDDVWYTEQSLNWDGYEHTLVFPLEQGYLVAWEDLPDGGDQDFNDYVVEISFTNPAALDLSFSGEPYHLFCTEDTVCFDVNAYGGVGNLTLYQVVDGVPSEVAAGPAPLTYEHCFLPWPLDSTYQFAFRVEDETGEVVDDTFSVEIEMNSKPQLAVSTDFIDTLICDLEVICFDVISATDPDNDDIEFNLLEGPGTIDPVTGEICFLPDDVENAYYLFVVEAADSCCGSFGQVLTPLGCPRDTVQVQVLLGAETIITTIDDFDTMLCVPEEICFPVTATSDGQPIDVHQECGIGVLEAGQLCFTPDTAGTYQFCFYAIGRCCTVRDTVNITIEYNQPPTAFAGDDQSYSCTSGEICWPAGCDDPDGNLISCELVDGPGSFDGSQICFEPPGTGIYEFVLQATDICLETDLDTVIIEIQGGEPPVAYVADSTLAQCDPEEICIAAWCDDPDGDLETCELIEAPQGAQFDGSQICFTPTESDSYQFVLMATDACANTDLDTGVVVVDINTGPQVNPGGGNFRLCEPDSVCVPVNVYDPDGDQTISTTMGHIDDGLVCIWSGEEPGTHQFNFTVSATDTCGHQDQANFTINLVLNMPPEIAVPSPEAETVCAGGQLCFDVDAVDSIMAKLVFNLLDGEGSIDSETGEVCFNPGGSDTYFWEIEVVDSCGAADTGMVSWQLEVIPEPTPVLLPPDGDTSLCFGDPVPEIVMDFSYEHPDLVQNIAVMPDNGEISWSVNYANGSGELSFTPLQDQNQTYGFTFELTDICNNVATSIYNHTVSFIDCDTSECLTVTIEQTECVPLGTITNVDISVSEDLVEIGGYDLLITYDASAFTVVDAQIGPAIGGWEYFTYRHSPYGNCGGACPSGMLKLVAIADINNGANHPPQDQLLPDGVVARIAFRVINNSGFAGYVYPVEFYWWDCGDNGISSATGDTLLVDKIIYGPERIVWDEEDDVNFPEASRFPGIGVPDSCMEGDKNRPLRCVVFHNGSICIISNDSIDLRGDINLNNLANEIGDAVLFTNYFLKGLGVFDINVHGQIAATDINNDGLTLTIGDLIYLLRIITGDALPFPKLVPYADRALLELNNDSGGAVISTRADVELGGLFLKVRLNGAAPENVVPLAGIGQLSVEQEMKDGLLHLIAYSDKQGASIDAGRSDLLRITGSAGIEIVHAEASDYYGNLVDLSVTRAAVPDGFRLEQNYPNPFNPETEIAVYLPQPSDWRLTIFNIKGQMVREFSGFGSAGVTNVAWDATDEFGQPVATGIYLYRLDAGEFSDTKKMLLIK